MLVCWRYLSQLGLNRGNDRSYIHIQHAICQLRWWSSVNIQARPHAVGEQVAGVEQNFMSAGKKKRAFLLCIGQHFSFNSFWFNEGAPN